MSRARPRRNSRPSGWACGLASWPLITISACSVYESSLLGDAAAPLGGSAADGGTGGAATAGGGTEGGGHQGPSGNASAGSGGVAVAGQAVDASQGGSRAGAPVHAGGGDAAGTATSGIAGEASDHTELIDDMEDGDAEIEIVDRRNGYWYVGGDLTAGARLEPPAGKFEMTELSAERSTTVAHVKAAGFEDWGSVIGFNFVELLRKVQPYDASAFCGIEFWGRAAAATTVRFRVPDIDTHQSGMVCMDPGTTGTACYDHFGTALSFAAAWQQYSVPFSELMQDGSGYHPADGQLKRDQLMAVEWALPGGTSKTFELWIDDVAFTQCP